MRSQLCALFFLLAAGCQAAPVDPAPPPVEPATTETAEESAANTATPLGQLGDHNAEVANALSSLAQVMTAMRTGSERAASAESDPCRAARASMQAAMRALSGWVPPNGRAAPRWELAPEERYLTLCRTLPETLQRCSLFHYRTGHRDECQAALAENTEAAAAYEEMAHPAPR